MSLLAPYILFPAAGGGGTTFLFAAGDNVDRSSYTFTNPGGNFNTSDRIVVGVFERGTGITITGVSVGGTAGTQRQSSTSTGSQLAEIWDVVPTGTPNDEVVVTLSGGNAQRCGVGVYNFGSLTYVTGATGSTSANVNTTTGDSVVLVTANTGNTAVTMTGVTEEYDANIESTIWHAGGKEDNVTGETPRTMSTDASSNVSTASAVYN